MDSSSYSTENVSVHFQFNVYLLCFYSTKEVKHVKPKSYNTDTHCANYTISPTPNSGTHITYND